MLLPGGCELSPGIDFPTAPTGNGAPGSPSDGVNIGDGGPSDHGVDGSGQGGDGDGDGDDTTDAQITRATVTALGGGGAGGDDAGLGEDSGEYPGSTEEGEALGGSTP